MRGQRTNPIHAGLIREIAWADVVHCHQQHVLASSAAALVCRLSGRKVFVSDLGGGGWDVSGYVSTDGWYHGHLHISEYSRRQFGHGENPRARVILGGVDTEWFGAGSDQVAEVVRLPIDDVELNSHEFSYEKGGELNSHEFSYENADRVAEVVRLPIDDVELNSHESSYKKGGELNSHEFSYEKGGELNSHEFSYEKGGELNSHEFSYERPAVFVGRLMPHKGVNDLVDAAPADMPVELIGRAYHAEFLADLKRRAAGKRIAFRHDADDETIRDAYRRALCVVLPSVYRDVFGGETRVPELLGQTLLEGMACGVPAICTDVASMPEVVVDGECGFIVPPNDPAALRSKLEWLRDHPEERAAMGAAARRRVLEHFTWHAVVERCLAAYGEEPQPKLRSHG